MAETGQLYFRGHSAMRCRGPGDGARIPAGNGLLPLRHRRTETYDVDAVFMLLERNGVCLLGLPNRSAPGRPETGHSVRSNALEPGFHGVPAEPAHLDRGADDADVT
jgi:hypothetical protein